MQALTVANALVGIRIFLCEADVWQNVLSLYICYVRRKNELPKSANSATIKEYRQLMEQTLIVNAQHIMASGVAMTLWMIMCKEQTNGL